MTKLGHSTTHNVAQPGKGDLKQKTKFASAGGGGVCGGGDFCENGRGSLGGAGLLWGWGLPWRRRASVGVGLLWGGDLRVDGDFWRGGRPLWG